MVVTKISKKTWIDASPATVWKVLTRDEYNLVWMAEFEPGSLAKSDWKEGSEIVFSTPSGRGMFSRLVEVKPGLRLAIEHEDNMEAFKRVAVAKDMESWKGMKEIYNLSSEAGGTQLAIEAEVVENYYELFFDMWDKSLESIKELSESQQDDRLRLQKAIELGGTYAKSFPTGIQAAFAEVQKRLPSCVNRSFFGITYPQPDGAMRYLASATLVDAEEAGKYELEPFTVEAGSYAMKRIPEWKTDPNSIAKAFQGLMEAHPSAEVPGIEWYQGRDVVCLLKINESKNPK